MESAVSFAPLRPADFVNFAGRGGAGQGLLFAGRGGAGQPVFPRGGASIPDHWWSWCILLQGNDKIVMVMMMILRTHKRGEFVM